MRTDELNAEVAGLIARLSIRMRTDPELARSMNRDTPDSSVDLTLQGIEDAILGLVQLHIQVRRGL